VSAQLHPTPLESALLNEFHALYGSEGFPRPEQVSLLSRQNTGGGRYVDLSSPSTAMNRDGYLDLGGKFVEIDGVPNGLMAVVLISDGQPKILELTVYGGDHWDGAERRWALK
jgi:hypothetical protein